jgi:Arc/MetJ-type ribon-helix-helix transcriptional regulator
MSKSVKVGIVYIGNTWYGQSMKRSTDAAPVVKTSISLPRILIEFADSQVENEGYNSRSDLLADLLRKHKQELELHKLRLKELGGDDTETGGTPILKPPPKPPKDSNSSTGNAHKMVKRILRKAGDGPPKV